MKNLRKYSLSLLLGLLSLGVFANEPTTQAATPTVEPVASTMVADINRVNINTASAAEIQDKLVGIGAKKAQAIIEYRDKNGRFLSIEQLTEVNGIGKATLEKNRDRITLE